MFLTLAVILFILWILGFGVFHVAGALIHILIVLALISVIWHLIAGRRAVFQRDGHPPAVDGRHAVRNRGEVATPGL